MEEKLLDGKFYLFPLCTKIHEVIVTRQNLMYREQVITKQGVPPKPFISILMENIIGCKIFESKMKKDSYCCLMVNMLMKNKKGMRERKHVTFCIFQSDDKQENMTITETWARTLSWLARDPTLNVEELQEKEDFPEQRKYFILINPKSGKGKSLELFNSTIEPILKDAMIKYEAFITEYSGHVMKLAKDFDHKKYDAIIICSGDGLAYEYINGIMKRVDWEDCLQTPIGMVPTGSGNALSASINYAADENFGIVNAMYVLLKGKSHPMDLFSCHNSKGTVYGFLSLTWGLLSDVDIESEKYRFLGPLRFLLVGVQRILSLRHYHGTFYYLPALDDENRDVGIEQDGSNTQPVIDDVDGDSSPTAPEDIELVPKPLDCGPKCTIPALNEECGTENWKKIENEFILLGLQSISHLGSDMHSAPGVHFSDGYLDLQYVSRGTTKKRMLDLLDAFETGKHLEYDDVEQIKIKAFRLVPGDDRTGHIAVDGEEVDYEPIQGEVLPSLANAIMLMKI